jgi:hypothetical protein
MRSEHVLVDIVAQYDEWRRLGGAGLDGGDIPAARAVLSARGLSEPAWSRRPRCFCIARAKNEQNTWPRMAASEE